MPFTNEEFKQIKQMSEQLLSVSYHGVDLGEGLDWTAVAEVEFDIPSGEIKLIKSILTKVNSSLNK